MWCSILYKNTHAYINHINYSTNNLGYCITFEIKTGTVRFLNLPSLTLPKKSASSSYSYETNVILLLSIIPYSLDVDYIFVVYHLFFTATTH